MERISHAVRINISHLKNTELTFKKSSGTFQYISYIDIFNVITWSYFQLFVQSE